MKNLSAVSQALEAKLKALFGKDNVEYNKEDSEYYSDDEMNYMVFEITRTFHIGGENGDDEYYGMEVDIDLDTKELTLISDGNALHHVMKKIDDKIDGFTTIDGETVEIEDESIELTKYNYDPGVMYYPNGDPGYPPELDYAFAGEVTIRFSINIREDD